MTPGRKGFLALLPQGATGAEIGVFRGRFSRRILAACAPRRLYLVDPWKNRDDPALARAMYAADGGQDMEAALEQVRGRFAEEIAAGQVVLLRGTAEEGLGPMPPGSLDFVYVDGDHRFEAVP